MSDRLNGSEMNILNKEDRSMAPMPSRSSTSKRTKFDWSTGGTVGEFQWIHKNDLNIDGRYQREECSHVKVMEIARSWDWLLLGVVSVIRRGDGTYWVFDGGHRTRAAFYRDDVGELPCMVHEVDNVNEEAKAFVARNTMVSNVAAYDRFRASVCASEPTAVKVNALLNEFGLTVVKCGTKAGTIMCVGALQRIVEEDYESARKVLAFCLSIAGEYSVVGKVLLAMFALQQRFRPQIDIIERYREKLSRHSQREIEVKISQFVAECGGKSGSTIHAKAILELINYKNKTHRLEW